MNAAWAQYSSRNAWRSMRSEVVCKVWRGRMEWVQAEMGLRV
jgi:hypothetical protein